MDFWFLKAMWYILCSVGTFFPVLVSCTKKNLATPAKSPRYYVFGNFRAAKKSLNWDLYGPESRQQLFKSVGRQIKLTLTEN
jgi:hypothetical protein